MNRITDHRPSPSRHAVAVTLFAITTLACSSNTRADVPVSSPLTAACQACHGRDGVSESAEIPNLAGQKKAYLVRQLEAFKRGERKNDLMAAIAAQLSDADIQSLATLWSQWPAVTAASTRAPSTAAIPSRMNFPAGFPDGFALYQTVGDAADKRVVKRYANGLALQAAREGKPLPSGALIIVATHAVKLDTSQQPVLDAQGQPVAAELLSYSGMESRAGWGEALPQLLRNGDWDYALFGPDRVRRANLNQAACLACHKPVSSSSHVFTMQPLLEFASRPLPRAP